MFEDSVPTAMAGYSLSGQPLKAAPSGLPVVGMQSMGPRKMNALGRAASSLLPERASTIPRLHTPVGLTV